jgi:hypothetical protein
VNSVIPNKEDYSTAGSHPPIILGNFFGRAVEECVSSAFSTNGRSCQGNQSCRHNMVENKRQFTNSLKLALEVRSLRDQGSHEREVIADKN